MFRFVRLAAVTAAATFALVACSNPAGTPGAVNRTVTQAPTGSTATSPPASATTSPTPTQPPVPTGGSGLQGVTVTRNCPVETEPPCPATAVAAHVVVSDANGTVAAINTDMNGRFTIALKPGRYSVRATPIDSPIILPATTTVTVTAARYAPLTLMLDSGIR
jgi:hypothetical protein